MLYNILLAIEVIVAVVLTGLILVQHGEGADAGAAFGSGASGTVFGAQGSANFMSRATAGLAVVFFVISLALTYLVTSQPIHQQSQTITNQIQKPGSQLLDDQSGKSDNGANTAAGAEEQATENKTPEKQQAQKQSETQSESGSKKSPEQQIPD